MAFHNLVTQKLEFYGAVGHTILATIDVPPGSPKVWTLRWFASLSVLAMLYQSGQQTRLRVWSTPNLEQISDIIISSTSSVVPLLTGWTDPTDGTDYPIGFAGKTYFVLSKKFVGIVPYADFSGLTCAAALKELSLLCGCYARVDAYKVGHVLPRLLATRDPNAAELDDPLELEQRPISEDYRASVEVRANDLDGAQLR